MLSGRILSVIGKPSRVVRWCLLGLAVASAAGGAYWYQQHKRYRHFATHDEGRVYRSAWVDADVFSEVIEQHEIRTVVNLCFPGEMGDRIQGQRKAVSEAGARLLEIPFPPNDTWSVDYPAVEQVEAVFADPDNYPIWIHCQHGRERTVKALAIYDINHRQRTARESLEAMPLFGMPHPWPTVVFAHNYETRQAAAQHTLASEDHEPLR